MKAKTYQASTRLQKTISLVLLIILTSLYAQDSKSTIISDLLITEIMANPNAVGDSRGEWFELYNPTSDTYTLNGITLSDRGTDFHTITSSAALIINPGEFFVLGRNANELLNGGYVADYVYSNFVLSNSEDEIILTDTIGNTLSLAYEAGFITAGASNELQSPEMLISNYEITSNYNYGNGDLGTPGTGRSYSSTAVPEPSSLWILLIGLGLFVLLHGLEIYTPRRKLVLAQ